MSVSPTRAATIQTNTEHSDSFTPTLDPTNASNASVIVLSVSVDCESRYSFSCPVTKTSAVKRFFPAQLAAARPLDYNGGVTPSTDTAPGKSS